MKSSAKVVHIHYGGTITMRWDGDYWQPTDHQFLSDVSGLSDLVDIERDVIFRSVARADSTNMHDSDYDKIGQEIAHIIGAKQEYPKLEAIVLSGGSDSQEQGAKRLSFYPVGADTNSTIEEGLLAHMHRVNWKIRDAAVGGPEWTKEDFQWLGSKCVLLPNGGFPVIAVNALNSIYKKVPDHLVINPHSDGHKNIVDAYKLALSHKKPAGMVLVSGGNVHRASRVQKAHGTSPTEAFQSIHGGPLFSLDNPSYRGVLTAHTPQRTLLPPHNTHYTSGFDRNAVTYLVQTIEEDLPMKLQERFMRPGLYFILLRGYGAEGNIREDLQEPIRAALHGEYNEEGLPQRVGILPGTEGHSTRSYTVTPSRLPGVTVLPHMEVTYALTKGSWAAGIARQQVDQNMLNPRSIPDFIRAVYFTPMADITLRTRTGFKPYQ